MQLRIANAGDAAALIELERHFPGDRLSPRAVRRLLRAATARVWVMQSGDEVVAALVLLLRAGSGYARIYSLVVSPAVRGRGLASRLVGAAEAETLRLGRQAIGLEVRADNAAARALYAGLGYRERQRLPSYYEDGGDGLRLRKTLAPPGGARGRVK